MKRISLLLCSILLCCTKIIAQDTVKSNDHTKTYNPQKTTLAPVKVKTHKKANISRLGGAENGIEMGQGELFRAACFARLHTCQAFLDDMAAAKKEFARLK